ncbi:MAG: hypothetical protein AB7E85_03865 [Pseudobdellovibrionaceae bacterium]
MGDDLLQFAGKALPFADAAFLPIAALMARKGHKIFACLFVLSCMITLRLQRDMIYSTGHFQGFTGWLSSDVFYRGMIVYAAFISLFMVLSYYSPGTRWSVYIAASLSIFFMAFVASTVMMAI